MNNNTLGIIAVSAVALGGTAAIALLRTPRASEYRIQQTAAYGMILYASDTDITPDQWMKIKHVLERPTNGETDNPTRLKLYRVARFVDGVHPSSDSGELPETKMILDYKATVEKLESEKFTGYAYQIGLGGTYQKYPINAPDMPQAHGKVKLLESQEMVEEVNLILDGP